VADGAEVLATCRGASAELEAAGVKQVISGVEVQDTESVKRMAEALGSPVDFVINNAGYFMEGKETLANLDDKEELKQIDICALGPLRVVSALSTAGCLKAGAKVAIISSQAGSAAWRPVQNKDAGGDYGHHMSRAACNMAMVLAAEELKKDEVAVTILHPGFCRTSMTAKYSHIWDVEGAVEPEEGAKRVLYEMEKISMERSGKFFNCEDGLMIPW
jgi:NAD(P)-dependent dehydrogenase (short-subunit alcohol dehydrogenase family)